MNETLLHVMLTLSSIGLYVLARLLGRAIFGGRGLIPLDATFGFWLPTTFLLGFYRGMDYVIPVDLLCFYVLLYVVITMMIVRWIGAWLEWSAEKKQVWWLASVLTPLLLGSGLLAWAVATGQ